MKHYLIISITVIVVCLTITSTFALKKMRVVSLAPNLTETVFQLKRGDCLVGRSSASNYLKKTKNIPVVGDFGIPSIEQLLLVKPDIVIATVLKDQSIKETIKKAGIKFYMLPTNSIDEYCKTVKTLGKLLNAEKNADHETTRIKNGLKNYVAKLNKIPYKERPTVFWNIWSAPLMTVGNQSFLNDFIYYAGGHNIAASKNKGYFNVSMEWVLSNAPDVIIAPGLGDNKIAQMKKQLGWKSTPAAKNNRIHDDLDPNLIYLLGPRMLEAIQLLHNYLHGIIPEKG
jgi:iron complex transport system substrate-binding protein